MPLRPLELLCFGPPRANLVGRKAPRELGWQKHIALLIYLALAPSRSCTRDELLNLLWPEQPDHTARKALNTAINRLRTALGRERLRSDGDTLTLADAQLEVDALRFRAEADAAPETAVMLLARGEFLQGFHVDNASDFDLWMTQQRTEFHARAAATLIAAGEQCLATDMSRALEHAERARRFAPRSEPAIRLLMHAAALAGNTATALGAYREFADELAKIGEQPARALADLAERIRKQNWRPPGTSVTLSIPLVGRAALHRRLFDVVAQLTARSGGGPRAVVILSAPGMGRTRLLAECTQRLGLEGAQILQIRPVKNDQDAPWSTLRLLVTSGVASLQGLAGAEPEALAALASLVPQFADRFAPREVKGVADMASGLANVLSVVAEERPLAIAIDDAHWADGTSLATLDAAFRQVKNRPAMLLLTAPLDVNDSPSELLDLEGNVGRDLPGVIVPHLEPLEEGDVRQLVTALAPWSTDSQRDRLTRRIIHESGGEPLLAVTLLTSLASPKDPTSPRPGNFPKDMLAWPPPGRTIDAPWPGTVSAVVRLAVAIRLRDLTPPQLNVLAAASVAQVLDVEVIAAMTKLSPDDVDLALGICERRHLLHFDGRRHTFAAPLILAVIRAYVIPKSERSRLEDLAIKVLAGRKDFESRATRVELLARAAPDQEALDVTLALVQDAWKAGARRVVNRALAAAEQIQQEAKLSPEPIRRVRSQIA